MRFKKKTLSGGLFLAATLLACAASDEIAFRPGGCAVDIECGAEAACINGICLADAFAPEQTFVEIDPAANPDFAPTQFLSVNVDGGSADFVLPEPATLELFVQRGETLVASLITLIGNDRIPGREAVATRTIVSNATEPPTWQLVPGDYTIKMLPNDSPGVIIPNVQVRDNGGTVRREFEIPNPYPSLSGRIVSSVQTSSAIKEVEVFARAEPSGFASTSTASDLEGSFRIDLPDTRLSSNSFTVFASPPKAMQPAWGVQQSVQFTGAAEIRQIALEPTSPQAKGAAKIKVSGRARDGSTGPVANAAVKIRAESPSQPNRTYFTSGQTDDEGFVVHADTGREVPIIRGSYGIEVSPPSDSDFARVTSTLDLSEAGQGLVLDAQVVLPARAEVRGQFGAVDGLPLGFAEIEFRGLEEGLRDGVLFSESDGTFSFLADPGEYLLIMRPSDPEIADFPSFVQKIIVGPVQLVDIGRITVPNGLAVTGRITGEDGTPLPFASVEFFVRREDRTISVAFTVSDAEGFYRVVLPTVRR